MLSIIAIVINNLEVTRRFVSSVKQYTTGEYELILIDNASDDEQTIEFIKNSATLSFRFENKVSVARAWNKGIELSKGQFIAVVNNDTVVSPNWFEPLKETLMKHEKAGMVSPMTYWIIRDHYIKHGAYRRMDKNFIKPIKLEKFKEVIWGEFCVFKRKALENVGGYCELYEDFGAEDLEMSFKLFEKGYDLYIDLRVFIYHEGNATQNLIDKSDRDRINDRNFELFKSRWPKYAGDWK